MKNYSDKLTVLVENMLRLHLDYGMIFDVVQVSCPNEIFTMDELLDLIIKITAERLV